METEDAVGLAWPFGVPRQASVEIWYARNTAENNLN